MFEDAWLDKDENAKLQEVLFDWLLHSPKVLPLSLPRVVAIMPPCWGSLVLMKQRSIS